MSRTLSPDETAVLATLQPYCMTTREVAAKAELPEDETWAILRRLGDLGLARTIAAGWWEL